VPLIADLHLHSRFSRATSRDLDFGSLYRAALEKGITIVGTGDVTHPGLMTEIETSLEPAEEGLFRLRPELAGAAEEGLPGACGGEVRFVLQVEISNIYKKDGKVRKNHNLVFLPSLEAARRFTDRLATIGNLASDGRPDRPARVSDPGPHLDAVVLDARLQVGLRLAGGVLRRPGGLHLRGRDRTVV
jgi:DNA helicase-2/ATP-dependent DNA helicase PcrA